MLCIGREINMKKVGIVMGSASDLPVVKKTIDILVSLGVPYEVHVYSAHRTPDEASDFSFYAKERGFGVIMAAAGMAAHLAGVIASRNTLPVIGSTKTGFLILRFFTVRVTSDHSKDEVGALSEK